MKALLSEIRAALRAGIWSPALVGTLVIPDACGAIEYPDLKGNRERYVRWFDKYVGAFGPDDVLTGNAFWKIRNGMLHETGLRFSEYGFSRVGFTLPNQNVRIGQAFATDCGPHSAFTLDLGYFFERVEQGVENWLTGIEADAEKRMRLAGLIQLRPQGMPPVVVGVPVIV